MGGVGQAWRLNLPPPRDEAKGCTTVPFCNCLGGTPPTRPDCPWLARHQPSLDRDLLTRRDLEQLVGVSRALAATLMWEFSAELQDAPAHRVASAAAVAPGIGSKSALIHGATVRLPRGGVFEA